MVERRRLLPLAIAGAGVDSTRRANVQLAFPYQPAASVLTKMGEPDLAFICADRGDRAVQESPDLAAPRLRAADHRHALLANAQFDDALAVVDQTLSLLPN